MIIVSHVLPRNGPLCLVVREAGLLNEEAAELSAAGTLTHCPQGPTGGRRQWWPGALLS